MIHALKFLLVGFALGAIGQPPSGAYGVGWADAPCRWSGRTISEDFYTRTYVRDCTWVWRAEGGPMRVAEGAGLDGKATNEFVHFKASARCSAAEWYRRVVVLRESRDVCRHRGGHAT